MRKTSHCTCTLILKTLTIFFFLLLRTEDSTSRNLIYEYRVNTQVKLLTKTGPQKEQIHSCHNVLFLKSNQLHL